MQQNFSTAIAYLCGANFADRRAVANSDEGGISNDAHDSGGLTDHGVTQKEFTSWLRITGGDASRSVVSITFAECVSIYRHQYADLVKFDYLPSGIDYSVFDFAVNSGPPRSVTFLQMIVCPRPEDHDGILGLETLHDLNEWIAHADADPIRAAIKLIEIFDARRLSYLQSLSGWRFFPGWGPRVANVKARSIALATTAKVLPL